MGQLDRPRTRSTRSRDGGWPRSATCFPPAPTEAITEELHEGVAQTE
jgi:hypothetical protein